MTYLCLDVGARRTGAAISDPTGLLARPLDRYPGGESAAQLARRLAPLIDEHDIEEIVVGLPRRLGGEHGPEAERIEALARELEGLLEVPITLWDERLSTVEAQRLMLDAGVSRKRRKAKIDQIAATVILQSYLDSRRSRAPAGAES